MPVSPETMLISSVLRAQDVNTAIIHGVHTDLFHVHELEWEWIANYYQRYRRCPSRAAFINAFPDFRVKQADDIGHFADEVRKSHARHVLTETMSESVDLLADGSVDRAIANLHSKVASVAANLGAIKDSNIIEDWEGTYADARSRVKRHKEQGSAGIPTGFDTVDELTGGVGPGQHWVVGARLGEGKSWTLGRMAVSALLAGKTVQFDALEMTRSEMSMRIHNFLSGKMGQSVFASSSLMQGKDFDLKEYRQFLRDMKDQIDGAIHVSDQKVGTLEIAAQIERNKPDIVFIDYFQLLRTQGDRGWSDWGKVSNDIIEIGKQYEVGIVSAAQLNRTHGLGKEPADAEGIGQSDIIGQDATAIITTKKVSDSVIKMKMAKWRHGRGGVTWYCHFDPDKGMFEEVSYNRAMDIKDRDADRHDAEGES